MGKKSLYKCDWCGKVFQRYPSQVEGKRHLFCSRECLASYSNKSKNPDGYISLKDYYQISRHMTNLNRELNPERMTPELRATMRKIRLNTGEGKNYSKLYGALEHRKVAAKMLGRDLKPGEVVHHMDFNIRNPEPANLMIFPSNSAHTKYHNALRRFFDNGTLPQEPIVEVTE